MKICSKCRVEKPLPEFYFRTDNDTYRATCRKCDNARNLANAHKNIERTRARKRKWATANREKCLESHRRYNAENREKINAKNREFSRKNPDKRRAGAKAWLAKPGDKQSQRRIVNCLRVRVRIALRGKCKSASTAELLGCQIHELKEHLEMQFKPGMTWGNYGLKGWHIDHKRPCASFDLTDPTQQRKCFHYTNLQPLWEVDNLKKSDNYGGD